MDSTWAVTSPRRTFPRLGLLPTLSQTSSGHWGKRERLRTNKLCPAQASVDVLNSHPHLRTSSLSGTSSSISLTLPRHLVSSADAGMTKRKSYSVVHSVTLLDSPSVFHMYDTHDHCQYDHYFFPVFNSIQFISILSVFLRPQRNVVHDSPHVSEVIQNSLVFWIPCCRLIWFQVLDSGFLVSLQQGTQKCDLF